MTDHLSLPPTPSFKDRKSRLVALGILQIILGVFCILLMFLMFLGLLLNPALGGAPTHTSLGMTLLAVLFYGWLGAWFVCMGIGSIKARRWARALVLVSSWIWLISGISGLVFMVGFMPDVYAPMVESGQMPAGMATVVKLVTFGFMTLFYVALPGLLVLLYQGENVKQTCAFHDPRERWTDKCPLPVLAACLMFGLGAVSMPTVGVYGWAIPFFGVILSGAAGASVALILMGLFAVISRGLYFVNPKAWWGAMTLVVIWSLSASITFSRVPPMAYYETMNFPEDQLEMMRQLSITQDSTMAWYSALCGIAILAYLIFIKRFFRKQTP